MKTVTSMAEAMALGSDLKLYVDAPDSIRVYFPGEIPEPEPEANPVPQSVSKYKAMKALAAAGLADAYRSLGICPRTLHFWNWPLSTQRLIGYAQTPI